MSIRNHEEIVSSIGGDLVQDKITNTLELKLVSLLQVTDASLTKGLVLDTLEGGREQGRRSEE